jgi:hypothetical protein
MPVLGCEERQIEAAEVPDPHVREGMRCPDRNAAMVWSSSSDILAGTISFFG